MGGLSIDRFVCALPKTEGSKAHEATSSVWCRATAIAAAGILLLTGILALCKVGSFSKLGPKYGWSAVGVSIAMILTTFSVKYKALESRPVDEGSTDATQRNEPTDRAEPVAVPVPSFKKAKEFVPMYQDKKADDLEFVGNEVVAYTQDKTVIYSPKTGEPSLSLSGQANVFCLAKEGPILVQSNLSGKVTILSIDPQTQVTTTLFTCERKSKRSVKAAISGDRVAIALGHEIQIWSCEKKAKIKEWDVEGEVMELDFLDHNRVACRHFFKRDEKELFGLEVMDLKKGKKGYSDSAPHLHIVGEDVYVVQKGEEIPRFYSISEGKFLGKLPENVRNSYERMIYHKGLLICASPEIEGNQPEGAPFRFIDVFTNDGHKFLQRLECAGHWDTVAMKMVGEDLVVTGVNQNETRVWTFTPDQ